MKIQRSEQNEHASSTGHPQTAPEYTGIDCFTKPCSDLAFVWMIEHGCYTKEEHKKMEKDFLAAKERLRDLNRSAGDHKAKGESAVLPKGVMAKGT